MVIAVQVRYSVEAGVLLLGLCVLLGPLLAERGRLPGLLGLVAGGALLGPHVLHWLEPGGFIATLGAAGLLYLMFVAGVELDLKAFAANRRAALVFGIATFAVPFALSFVVGRYQLGLGLSATALVGAMWASHTVVSYPEAKSAGVDRSRAVGVALAATVITDVAALVILAIAASNSALAEAPEVAEMLASGSFQASTSVPLWAGLVVMVVVCFVVVPISTRWLFEHVLFQRTQRFVWALVAMAAGAVAGLLGGIEGLVGAFLAGIGMNTAVPARSELMERIEFIGNSLLIPAFLISVGLSVDPAALVDPPTLATAGVFVAIVVVGKAAAAYLAGRAFRYERAEIALMASLTIGQAAATLAIAQVGVATGLFDDRIRYAAIVTVAVTVVVASIGTQLAARRIRLPAGGIRALGDHVLVLAPPTELPVAGVAGVASRLVERDGGLVTPVSIRSNRKSLSDVELQSTGARLRALDEILVRLGHDTDPVQRVADDVVLGVGHVADEIDASVIVAPLGAIAGDSAHADLSRLSAAADLPVVGVVDGIVVPSRVVLLTPADRDDERNLALRIAGMLATDLDGTVWCWPPTDLPTTGRTRPLPGDAGSNDVPVRAGDIVVGSAQVLGSLGDAAPGAVMYVAVTSPARHRPTVGRSERPLLGAITPSQG